MKNKIIALTLLGLALIAISPVYAQKIRVQNQPNYDLQPYHFGFLLGINQMMFTIKPAANFQFDHHYPAAIQDLNADSANIYSMESSPSYGFTVGIISNLRLGKYFDLRFIPSLSLGERAITYNINIYDNGVATLTPMKKSVQSTYIDLPLHIKYKAKRINNVRPYIFGGARYVFDLASRKKKSTNTTDTEEVRLRIARNDAFAEIGVGFDFYNSWFKFGTEIKMGYGLSNILNPEDNMYASSIDQLNSKMFQISFTFE